MVRHTHSLTHVHTHTRKYTYATLHAHTLTYTHTHEHPHHIYTYSHIHVQTRVCTHIRVYHYTYTYSQTHICTHTHTFIRVHTVTHHTHAITYILVHIHTHAVAHILLSAASASPSNIWAHVILPFQSNGHFAKSISVCGVLGPCGPLSSPGQSFALLFVWVRNQAQVEHGHVGSRARMRIQTSDHIQRFPSQQSCLSALTPIKTLAAEQPREIGRVHLVTA